MTPDWLRESVLRGLQGLLVLRLQWSPAHDTVTALANAWIAILGNLPHTWDETRDKPRLQKAFLTLATNCKQWPAPAMLIEALPRIENVVKLPPPQSRNVPPEVRMFLNKFLKRSV